MKSFISLDTAKKFCAQIAFLIVLSVLLAAIARPQSVGHPDRPPAATRQSPELISSGERALFELLNRERTSHGFVSLQWDPNLAVAARLHAQRMVDANNLSHQFPGEPDLLTRLANAGAKFSSIAENVAEGPDPPMIHDSWMHSPGHRANILDPQNTAVGIAVIEGRGNLFAVQDFSHAVVNVDVAEQEKKVSSLLTARGLKVENRFEEARKSCDANYGISGVTAISIIRFEASDLSALPDGVVKKLAMHSFLRAAVGGCPVAGGSGFTHYRLVILLY
jgi:uncharacterized protein YkwD